MPKATIMIGPAGCGKSTYVREKEPPGAICSADSFHMENGLYNYKPERAGLAHSDCLKMFLELIERGYDVIVDNTNVSMYQVAPYIALARAFSYDINCIVFSKADPEVCAQRTIHQVPLKTVFHMYYEMQKLIKEWPSHWPMLIHIVPPTT